MKKKIIFITFIVLGIILSAFISFYFVRQSKSLSNLPENTIQQNQNNLPENSVSEDGAGNQSSGKLVTDDFEIDLPAGWEEVAPPMGTSIMAVNKDEKLDDPAAQRINFRSYFAVSYDTLQGKGISEYLENVKSQLEQAIPNVVFRQEQNTTINGRTAWAVEANLTQQGVDFEILMVVVKGEGDDVWVISFNTLQSSWAEYQETFSNIAHSFNLKK